MNCTPAKSVKRLLLCLCFVLVSCYAHAQKVVVSGRVVTADGLKPISGALIKVRDTAHSTYTDKKGNFSLDVHRGQKITVSYLGFQAETFTIMASQNFEVPLKIKEVEAEEIVVVGYGTVKKSHLTGAVSKVENTNLDQIPVSRADDALMGKLAGVNVQKTDAQAGAEPTIQIRGATSITAGSQPLIVVDGYPVPTDLSAIDMSDVQSIEVLKDAASAAIYGSRGGNGVLLITTKSGKTNRKHTSININSGIKEVYRKIETVDLETWKNYVATQNKGVVTPEILQAEKFNAHSDIQDAIFRKANFSNAAINTSGGNASMRYYFSGNYLKDDGVMRGNDYNRFGGKFGFDAQLSKKVKAGFSYTPSYTTFYNVPVDAQEAIRNVPSWMPFYHTEATAAATGMAVGSYTSQRHFSSSYNPAYTGTNISASTSANTLATMDGVTDKTTMMRNLLNVYLQYNITPYLSFKTSGGLLSSSRERNYFQKSFARADPVLDGDAYARSTSNAILDQARLLDLLNENILSYKRAAGKHDFDAILGFTAQYTVSDTITATANNFATDEIPTLNAGVMKSLGTWREKELLLSTLFRLNYAYNNKYLLSVSARRDGSSRFGANNRWGFFPAASAGWNIARESFFPKTEIVNDAKLRASFGATGNKNIGNFRSLASVAPANAILGGDNVTTGFSLNSFGNPNLGWERTYSYNAGADFTLLNNRLTLSLEYYKAVTDDLLLNLPVAAATGFTGYYANMGKVSNRGMEAEFSYRVLSKKHFKWSISGNAYSNKNKLLDFGGSTSQINQGDPKRVNYFLTQVGSPLSQFYGYRSDSIVAMQGTNYWPVGVTALSVFVKDINGDGKIDENDRTVIGNAYPKLSWGLTSNFTIGSFDVSITVQGSHGAKVFNIDPYYYENQYGTTGATAENQYPAAIAATAKLKTESDFDIQDASFIALRNVNIGYAMPAKKVKKIGFTTIRLYISAANLYYHFADNYTSLNPEANRALGNDPLRLGYQRGAAPLARTITFGLNTTF